MKKKIAALTVATSLLIGSLGSVALAENTTTTTTTASPQSVITVPGENATTTSTTENQATTTTTETTTESTTTETTTETTTNTETEETTQTPEATMWVTKLDIPVDSPFYPILRVLEKLQLALTRGEELKAKLNAELAAKRIAEAQYLAAKAQLDETGAQVTAEVEKLTEQTTKLMEEAEQRLAEAQKLAEQVEQNEEENQDEDVDIDDDEDKDDCQKLIKAVNQHRIEVLSRVYLKVPATAKPSIMKNLVKFGATEEQLLKLTEALEKQVEKLDEAVQQAEKANLTELKASTEAMKMTTKPQEDGKKTEAKQLPPGQAKKLEDKQSKDIKGNNGQGNSKFSR